MKIFPPVYVTYGLQLLHYFVVITKGGFWVDGWMFESQSGLNLATTIPECVWFVSLWKNIFTPKNINIFVYSNKPMFIELYHGQGTEYESLYTGSNQLSKELFGIRNSFS